MIACPSSADLEGVTVVDTDPTGRIVSFKVTPSNDRILSVYTPSGHNTREQLDGKYFFEGVQNYMKHKREKNENKVILEEFDCIMDKINRDGGNKTQRLYKCGVNYDLSKLIVNNGFEDLWRKENPYFSEFTYNDRSSGARSRTDRVYSDKKLLTIRRLIT